MDHPVMSFTAVYLKSAQGYVGYVEELPGITSQGQTIEQARVNLQRLVSIVFEEERAQSSALLAGKEIVREEFRVGLSQRVAAA